MHRRPILILTVGSRGGVQPYVALGAALQRTGHEVRMAVGSSDEGLVRANALEFAPLRAEFMRLAQSAEGRAALGGKNPLSLMRRVAPMLRRIMDDAWDAAQGAKAIVYHPKALAGYHIAEKLNIPAFLAMMVPAYSPTRAFANPLLGGGNYGGFLNHLSYTVVLNAAIAPYRGLVNAWRKEKLGLPPFGDDRVLRGKPVPKLYACSPQLVPIPGDWDDSSFVTGCWFLPSSEDRLSSEHWQPSAGLLAFLERDSPPIYVGFGSMTTRNAARLTEIVLEAARVAEQRVILASGWGALVTGNVSGTAFALEAAPHEWLFPRCAAVVHHGGAGTTGAGLRAGRPTLVCPFIGDQPFWGRRVFELGVGPRPIAHRRLAVRNLAEAFHSLTADAHMRERAGALGQRIRSEDGPAEALRIIRRRLGGDFGEDPDRS